MQVLTDQDAGRDAGLRAYGLLPLAAGDTAGLIDDGAQEALENLVRLAASLCGVPYSVVNIITSSEQVQIAAYGIDPGVCAREDSMCAVVFLDHSTTVVRDASRDPRFAANPFVTGRIADVRFYASVPLETSSGLVLGSLCVFSDEAKLPAPEQIELLEVLAHQVVELLELQHRTLQLNDALAELRRSNDLLSEFAGRVSHDLRTPLTTILGYVELAQDDPGITPSDPSAEYLDLIGTGGRRMLGMLEEVLSYARVDGEIRPERVSLLAVTAEAAQDLGVDLGYGSGISCEDAEIFADRAQLRTLVQNLLGNSLNPIVRPRQLSIHGARRIRIITEIDRRQCPTAEIVGRREGPERRLQTLNDVARSPDLRRRLHMEGARCHLRDRGMQPLPLPELGDRRIHAAQYLVLRRPGQGPQ